MAKEAAETAGLGLDLDIKGLSAIKELAEVVNKIRAGFHGINEMAGDVTSSIKGLSATAHKVGKFNLGAGVGENIKAVQKLSTEMKRLPGERVDKIGGKFGDAAKQTEKATKQTHKLGDAFRSVGDKASKSGHRIRDIVAGSFIANGVINSWYSLKAGISEAIKAGEEYDKEQQVMHATWNTLTGDAKKGNKMVKAINDISVKFGQSSDLVNELNQQFYHVLDKQGPTDKLTKSVLTLADTLGMGAENVQRLGLNFTHMMSSGKMQLGDFNMITDQLPMFGERLLEYERKAMKNSKLSMAQLRADMSAGKVSAKDAEAVMNGLGKKYAKASENMMKTMSGMERVISARGKALSGALIKPIINAKNPLFGAVSKWVSDPHTETEFKKVGQSVSKGLGTITEAFSKAVNPTGSKKFADNMLNNLSSGITSMSSTIAKHAQSIINFFSELHSSLKILMQVGTGFAKGIVSGLNAIITPIGKLTSHSKHLNSFAEALKSISKQNGGLQTLGRTIAGFWAGSKALKIGKSLGSKVTRMFIRPEIDAETGKRELTLFSKSIRGTSKGIGRALKWTAKIGWKGAKLALGSLKGAVSVAASAVVKSLNYMKAGAVIAGNGLKAAFTFMKANPLIAIVSAVVAVGLALTALYKHNKKFRKFVNGLIAGAKKAFSGVVKWFKNLGKGVSNTFNSIRKGVNSRFGGSMKAMGKLTKSGVKVAQSSIRLFTDFFTGKWKRLGTDIKKLTGNLWKFVQNYFKAGFKFVDDLTGGRLSKMIGAFQDAWSNIGKGWHSFWNGIDSWFGKLWAGIKKTVSNGINGVIGVLNTGLSGINSVIHFFGGKTNTIGKISTVHLATGTGAMGSGYRRKITKPTLATLNDGNDSPETGNQEAIIHSNGVGELVKGRNTVRVLEPGAEVLNATELKTVREMAHFKKGTGLLDGMKSVASNVAGGVVSGVKGLGNFASKAWHGVTHLLGTLQKLVAHPIKTISGMFGEKSPKESGEMLNAFSEGMFGSVKKGATNWWKQLMGVVEGTLHSDSGGDTSGLVDAMEKYGHGHKYVWGATGPDTFDCSGLVMYALKHAFGISYPHFSGSQYSQSKHISKSDARPGDLVFFGPGGNEHVGVYAGHGAYYSALNPNRHPNIGMSPVSTGPGSPLYARVPGLVQNTNKGKNKSNNSAYARFNAQTGGMLGWIKKHLAPLLDTDSYGSDSVMGGAITHAMISKALSLAKVPHKYWSKMQHDIIAVAKSETGNQNEMQKIHDVNSAAGNPAGGPLQFTKSTFEAFAFPGHHNWRSSFDQVLAFLNNSQYASATGQTTILGHSKFDWLHSGPQGHKRFRKNGGKVKRGESYIVGEEGWEEFTPATDGTIKSHKESVNAQNRASARLGQQSVTIDAHMEVSIGSITQDNEDDVFAKLEKFSEAHVKKLRGVIGADDEGGIMA